MDAGGFVELRTHSWYSFGGGVSPVAELLARAAECGMDTLGLVDRGNLCGALEFTHACIGAGLQPVVGAEVMVRGGPAAGWIPFLATSGEGYRALSGLVTLAHHRGGRLEPSLDLSDLEQAGATGVVAVLGARTPLGALIDEGRRAEARRLVAALSGLLGREGVVLEVSHHLAPGDRARNATIAELAAEESVGLVGSNDVWYAHRSQSRVHDLMIAVGRNATLAESRRWLKPNGQYWLKSPSSMALLLRRYPEALRGTRDLADRCRDFRLDDWVAGRYRVPEVGIPDGRDADGWLEQVCVDAAHRRYGSVDGAVRERLDEELRLVRRHGLAGFLLAYRRIVEMGRECMSELGHGGAETPLEWLSPGRGRGSSVALLVGYLIGLSHVDPLAYGLNLERFISDDMTLTPDIDLDFPRDIRERLIARVIEEWGWDRAALAAMFPTYRMRGAIRSAGGALGLPAEEVAGLAAEVEEGHGVEILALRGARARRGRPGWRHLLEMVPMMLGLPKGVAQHPGGMLVSATPLTDMVPVQPSAMAGRYVAQWDKNSVDDAGILKIDLLGLGALSQLHGAVRMVTERTGEEPDLSRIDFNDRGVYDDFARGDTVGVFQVESAAQMQTIVRLRPADMYDLAIEIGAVRPGVGVNDGVSEYLRRRGGGYWEYTHPREAGPLGRTHGVILFQDQVVQLGMAVGGMTAGDADRMRRSLGRPGGGPRLEDHRERFIEGAVILGVDRRSAETIFGKFNAFYMFPEGHALAFAFTAYQMAWLRRYHTAEFYAALFNEQPMGFWDMDTLKQDAGRLGVRVLAPDVNASHDLCTVEDDSTVRLGLRFVRDLGGVGASRLIEMRRMGQYRDLADLVGRSGLSRRVLESLALSGALDGIAGNRDRAEIAWDVGAVNGRGEPFGQMGLSFTAAPAPDSMPRQSQADRVLGEYCTLGMSPGNHVMGILRGRLGVGVLDSQEIRSVPEGESVKVAGRVVRRQRPLSSAVYVTLEDEFGLVPVMVWHRSWPRLRRALSHPLVEVSGRVSRRDGSFNIVARRARPLDGRAGAAMPAGHDWK